MPNRAVRRLCHGMWLYAAAIIVFALISIVTVTTFVATSYLRPHTRVIYSLDQRKNDQEIVRIINDSRSYVRFAIYYFTETNIAEALIRAKKRGVDIRGIMDAEASTHSNKSVYQMLTSAGIPVEVQKHVDGIMHIKAIVTERAYASGSYNWTSSATEANDEILEIGDDENVRSQYQSIINRIISKNE